MKFGADVDGWTVTFGTARRRLGGGPSPPRRPLLAVPNVTAHPSTASVPTSTSVYQSPYYCVMVRCSAVLMWALKG